MKKFFKDLWNIIKIVLIGIGTIFIISKIKNWIKEITIVDKLQESYPYKVLNNKTISIQKDGKTYGVKLPDDYTTDNIDGVYLPTEVNKIEVKINHETIDRKNIKDIGNINSAYDFIKSR